MVNIVKSGYKNFKTNCNNCGCEFTYSLSDLYGLKYIRCPECGATCSHSIENGIEQDDSDEIKNKYSLRALKIEDGKVSEIDSHDEEFLKKILGGLFDDI